MNPSWLFYALAAPFLFSVSQVFDKSLRKKHLGTLAMSMVFWTASLWVLAIIPFIDLRSAFGSPLVILAGLAAGTLFVLNSFPYLEAMSIEEASRVIPLWAFEAIFVLALAFILLRERLLMPDYLGFALVVTGAFFVSSRKISEIFRPSRALRLMLLATFLTAIGVIISKWLYAQISFWQVQLLIGIGGGLCGLALVAIEKIRYSSAVAEIARLKRNTWLQLALRIVFVNAGFLLYSLAIKIGSASLTVALSNLNGLYMLIMATVISVFRPGILQEIIDRKTLLTKAVAILMIIAGVFAISI